VSVAGRLGEGELDEMLAVYARVMRDLRERVRRERVLEAILAGEPIPGGRFVVIPVFKGVSA